MKKLFVSILALAIVTFTGCKKESGIINISVSTPAAGATVQKPANLIVDLNGGNLTIHDISVKVFETTNTAAEILNYSNHVEVKAFTVQETLDANITAPTNFTIKVTAGEGNVTGNYSHTFTLTP
jgi:uncharacterized lipoprotein YajG